MRPDPQAQLQKIRQVSTGLRVVCKVVMAFLAVEFLIVAVMLLSDRGVDLGLHGVLFHVIALSFWRRLHLVVMIAISLGFLIRGLYLLHQLFGNYARGEIFTSDSARRLRQMGILYLIWSLTSALSSPLAYVSAHPPNPYQVDLHLDAIVASLCLLVISWVMLMAADLREENELTI